MVVTGMGSVSPAGIGVRALWETVRDGRRCGGPITRFDPAGSQSRIAAEVPGFDPLSLGLAPAEVARMDRTTQFARVAAREALDDAGLLDGAFDPRRAGVLIGTAVGGVEFMETVFRASCIRGNGKPAWVTMDPDRADPNLYRGFLAQSVSGEVAEAHGFEGFTTTMSTGCTAGLDAVGAACLAISSGMADVVVTGGADAPVTPVVVAAFDVIHCLTRRNDDPARASRPFDRDRDGFLLGEGCGVLVLEEEEHARARGATLHGRVLGFASLSNAYHMTGLPADGERLAATLRRALRSARVDPDEVDYVNAHGSSTPQNDRNETAAFKKVFGARARRVPVSSTKSVIGHSLGAASALESIVCVKAIGDAVVPPTANYETPCPDCDLDYVPNQARDARLRVVECNASGFSGIHSSVLFATPAYPVR